jgi:diguanylate cyclase (GGDEF)-like protein
MQRKAKAVERTQVGSADAAQDAPAVIADASTATVASPMLDPAAARLQRRVAAQQAWDRRKAEQINSAASQLRAPLSAMRNLAELLVDHHSSPVLVRDLAAQVKRNLAQLDEQVRQVQRLASLAPPPEALLPPEPGADESVHAEWLRQLLAAAEQRAAQLEDELAAAHTAQQQLQTYADDFRRTYAESRHRLQRMTALYEASSAIGSTIDPSAILSRTIDGLRRLLPDDSAAIYLVEEAELVAQRRALSLQPGTEEPPESVTVEESALGQTLSSGLAVLEGPDYSASTDRAAAIWRLSLPIGGATRRQGVLLLLRQAAEPFTDEERSLAEMIASQTAMALQNAHLAITDPLTGLYNRRYFEQALAFESERARRVHRPLGLLMIDIDHFKNFNEQYGHPAGDEVLRLVATTLTRALRRTDIIARVGGEEFAAILPEDDLPDVAIAAERLRRAVELTPPPVYEGCLLPGVRISVGGAAREGEAIVPRQLVLEADTALRMAKQRGRNQVVLTDEPREGESDG